MLSNPRLGEAMHYLYPPSSPGLWRTDFTVQDDNDGKGPHLAAWTLPGDPPTDEQIAAALVEVDKARANTAVKSQIDALETAQHRSIRELALGNNSALARLQALDAKIAALRATLQ